MSRRDSDVKIPDTTPGKTKASLKKVRKPKNGSVSVYCAGVTSRQKQAHSKWGKLSETGALHLGHTARLGMP